MTTTVTKTIRSSGGDYTSLTSWESGRQADLTSSDTIEVAECYDDWSTGLSDTVLIDGWTTDSTRYIKVTVASGHRHTGIPQTGFFLKNSASFNAVLETTEQFTQFEWLDAENTANGDAYAIQASGSHSGTVFRNCIARANSNSSNFAFTVVGGTTQIGCLAYGGSRGFNTNSFAAPTYLNCVAANCGQGFWSDSSTDITAKNCVAYNNTTNWVSTGWNGASTHNATSTGSDDAPGGNSVISVDSGDFVDAASNDFHIDTDSVLYEAGTDLSGTFTTDIDGDTWASTWSIGFDQPDAGGGAVTGTSSGTFTLTGSAAGAVQVAGSSTATVSLTGTAAGAVAVAGASAATVSLAGTAEAVVGAAPATGQSAGTFNLAGTGVASVLVDGSSAATITLAGTAAGTVSGGLEPRYGRPTTDTSAGSWLPSTGSDLYAMLDEETADDADYIYAESATTAVLKCTALDLAGMTTPVLRMKVPTGFTASGTLTLGLYQGNSPGSLVATIEETDPAAGLYEHQLTAGEMANITDGSDLYFRVTAAS